MAQNQNLPRMYQLEQSVLESIKLFFPDTQITLHDLRNPTPEAVSKVYGAFLEELGANIANLLQIQNNQMTLIAHVDMYNVSVPVLNQYQCINFFLKRMGVEIFSVSDLITPTSKRTLCFFDKLLKFLTYCDDRIANLQPELEKIRDLGLRRKELLSKIEVLRDDINRRASARGQRQGKKKELEEAIASDKEKLNELMNEKKEQITAQNSIKKLLEEDDERENQLKRTIKKIEDDVTELKGMLVKSPQKLTHLVDEQTQKREELLQNVKNLKSQIEEKKRLTQTICEQQLKQEERFQKIRDLFDIKLNIKNKEQEKLDLLDQYAKVMESFHENELRISSQEERRKIMVENVEEHRQRKGKWEVDDREQLLAAKKELEMLINHREEKMKYLNGVQVEINELCEDMERIKRQFLDYKKSETVMRSNLQSMKDNLVLKYENMIKKLRSINENLKN